MDPMVFTAPCSLVCVVVVAAHGIHAMTYTWDPASDSRPLGTVDAVTARTALPFQYEGPQREGEQSRWVWTYAVTGTSGAYGSMTPTWMLLPNPGYGPRFEA